MTDLDALNTNISIFRTFDQKLTVEITKKTIGSQKMTECTLNDLAFLLCVLTTQKALKYVQICQINCFAVAMHPSYDKSVDQNLINFYIFLNQHIKDILKQ